MSTDERLAAVWAVLDTANALKPEDFKTGQEHLSPAFRGVNFRDAFKAMVQIVNEIERVSGYGEQPTQSRTSESEGGRG